MPPHTVASLRIGQFAAACGVTPRTLRFYEERGLLPTPTRQVRTMRRYSPDLIPRVERIQQLQSLLDWSLEDIRAVLALEDQVATLRNRYHHSNSVLNRQALLEEATALTINQLTRVRQRLIGLQNLQQDLEEKLARYQALSTQSHTRGESC